MLLWYVTANVDTVIDVFVSFVYDVLLLLYVSCLLRCLLSLLMLILLLIVAAVFADVVVSECSVVVADVLCCCLFADSFDVVSFLFADMFVVFVCVSVVFCLLLCLLLRLLLWFVCATVICCGRVC